MKVGECMTAEPRMVRPDDTVRTAAAMMAEADAGCVFVGEGDRLVGVVTDRDIALRAIGAGQGPECLVKDVMSREIKYCYDDEALEKVVQNMGEIKMRRLPVVNRQKRLVGAISLGDLARSADCAAIGRAMGAIAQPAGAGAGIPTA